MSDTIDDGGPAFGEFEQVGKVSARLGGLSKRELYAAMAMQGILCGTKERGNTTTAKLQEDAWRRAHSAVRYADAMLAAMKEKPCPPST